MLVKNLLKNKFDFLVYALVYAVLNQINIETLYLFNEKGRSVTRCPGPCFYNPYYATKLMQLNAEIIKSLNESVTLV